MTKSAARNRMRMAALLLCGASLVLPAMAQDGATNDGPPPPGQMRGGGPGQRLEMMQKELNLTPDQTAKVKAILDEGRGKMMALRNDTATPQEEKRGKMMEMRRAENEKIKAVLDDGQKVKLDEMEKRMRGARQGGGGQAPPPAPPQP